MAWNLSTGFKDAILARTTQAAHAVTVASSITFTATEILDSGSGLAGFLEDAWVLVVGSTNNNNVIAKVLTSTAGTLTFAAASFTADVTGIPVTVMAVNGGSFLELMKNSRLTLYTGARPATADLVESGTKLVNITKDSGAMVEGEATNGLNLGQLASSTLKRSLDPSTAITEVWSGSGLADGTAGYGRWSANANISGGASSTNICCDGTVSTSAGGDIVMSSGTSIVTAAPAYVTDVTITASAV